MSAEDYKNLPVADDVVFTNQVDYEDAEDLVMEISAIKARIGELTAQLNTRQDVLRDLVGDQTGRVQGRDGHSVTFVRNERFNGARAKKALSRNPEALAAISTPSPNVTAARKALALGKITPTQYAACLAQGDAIIRVNTPSETTEDED